MVAFRRCLAAAWLVASGSAALETCDQEGGQCVAGGVFLQKGRGRSTAPVHLAALEEDSQLEGDLSANRTFVAEVPMKIGSGTDAGAVSFAGPVVGGQATNNGNALAARVAKKAGGTASKAEYVFYVEDGGQLRVAVVEVTRSGCCDLFARTVAVKRGDQPDTPEGALKVAQSGTVGVLSPVHTGKGFGAGFLIGEACASSAGHCSRCSADGQTCLVCEDGHVLEGYFCRKSCEAMSVFRGQKEALNLVFVPSGFKGEMEKWPGAVQTIYQQFAAYPLLAADSVDELSVFYVKDSAPEDDGSQCWFGCKNIDRLLCCNNALFERHAWRTCGSGFAVQLIVVHNSDKYGGAGGRIATTSINAAAPKIAAHEIGHSMFSLGDEYIYGLGTQSHANCDQAGCPKWKDLIDAKFPGVECASNNCKNGAFFASSSATIMKQLNGPFSPVQERIMCCKYLQHAGSAPVYCNKFNSAALPRKLNEYCQTNLLLLSTGREAGTEADSYSLGETRYVEMARPVEWELVKQGDAPDTWVCIKIGKLSPGVYPQADVDGDAETPLRGDTVRVKVSRGGAEVRQLRFNMFDTVEVPPAENEEEFDEMEHEAPEVRVGINMILEEGEACGVLATEG